MRLTLTLTRTEFAEVVPGNVLVKQVMVNR